MSEEHQHHIDEIEYNELVKAVGDSDLPAVEKDNLRELLSAGYRNLNGDPMEVKVKMLARTDWIQIKRTLTDSAKLSQLIKAVQDLKATIEKNVAEPAEAERPMSFAARLFDFLKTAKTEIATVICFAIFFPNGAAVLKVLSSLVNPGVQP